MTATKWQLRLLLKHTYHQNRGMQEITGTLHITRVGQFHFNYFLRYVLPIEKRGGKGYVFHYWKTEANVNRV